MREEKFHIYLNDDEYSRVIQSLIRLKNSLIAQGRYIDGAPDVLCLFFLLVRKYSAQYICKQKDLQKIYEFCFTLLKNQSKTSIM